MVSRWIALAASAILLLPAATASAGPGNAQHLRVIAFNVLAPLWASPVWYPEDMDTALLDREYRRQRVAAFLQDAGRDADVVCLQEVEEAELPYFLSALGGEFEGRMASNDPDYWSNWLVGNPWVPNGTAVIVRKATIGARQFADLTLSGSGNHAAAVSGVHSETGRPVRVVSVHLDSDSNANRVRELRALMDQVPAATGTVDIVCGDINEDTVKGSAAGIFKRNGYMDVLASVGNREATHPWDTTYNNSDRWAVIDHILVRGAEPVAGDVFDFGVWSIADETARIEENFLRSGSDHFPIGGEVRIPRL